MIKADGRGLSIALTVLEVIDDLVTIGGKDWHLYKKAMKLLSVKNFMAFTKKNLTTHNTLQIGARVRFYVQ